MTSQTNTLSQTNHKNDTDQFVGEQPTSRHIAIVGSGIGGLSTAFHLHQLDPTIRLTIFEKNDYFGGHTDTHNVIIDNNNHAVDTGFIVFNQLNYPVFCKMLATLGVVSEASDMSFSVSNSISKLTYNPSKKWQLLARPQNFLKKGFVGMIKDLLRFYAAGRQLDLAALDPHITLGDYLTQNHYGDVFKTEHLYPMCGALWSATPDQTTQLPLKFVLGFFANHQMLQVNDRPMWLTVKGGSNTYIQALKQYLGAQVQWLQAPVVHITRIDTVQPQSSVVVDALQNGQLARYSFDAVVLACHADEALSILGHNASDAEKSVLGAFTFRPNTMVLHTDRSIMPKAKSQWASWHVHIAANENHSPDYSITYWMNRLQNIHTDTPLLATLNPNQNIDPLKVLQTRSYRHPTFTPASFCAQSLWYKINGQHNTYFAGAYWGYGFHEDGAVSGLRAACAILGLTQTDVQLSQDKRLAKQDETMISVPNANNLMPTGHAPLHSAPISLAQGIVRHRRFHPKSHEFSYAVSYVTIDAACIDRQAIAAEQPLAINRWGFVSINRADLITPSDCSIFEAVRLRLEPQQITMKPDWRIDILTLPRFMGYTFNPVSFYTVYNSEQQIVAILSDITNTPWGERHTYVHIAQPLKNPGMAAGRTYQFELAKAFHVSPFMPMKMTYDWRFHFNDNTQVIHMRLLENYASNGTAQQEHGDVDVNKQDLKTKTEYSSHPSNESDSRLTFDATFRFSKQPFGRFSTWYLTLRYPLLPIRVLWQIHWQALRLWLKGVPFYRHPKKTAVMGKPPV